MVFSPKKNSDNKISVKLCDQELPIQTSTKFLGVWLDSNLDSNKQFSHICSKLKQNTGLMQRCKNLLTTSTLRSIYFAHIHSHLSYSVLVWGSTIKQGIKPDTPINVLYTVLPKYSKIQVLPGITSCRLVKDNKQAIELNSLLINNMPKDGYEWN